jgi:hypothetical protein
MALAACCLFAVSCRSTKKLQTAIARKDTTAVKKDTVALEDAHADSLRYIASIYQNILKHHIDYRTFSAKIKVNYEGGDGKSYDVTAFLRMEKDKYIWVSINAILGIEAFRILITPDSVKVINKLDKVVQLRSVGYLKDVAHIPGGFKTLQDLIIGNPIFLDSNFVFYRNDPSGVSLMTIGDLFKHYISLNGNDYTIRHSKLDDVDVMRARTCDLTYGDYEKRDSIYFSTYRKISVAEKSKLDIQLGFKQYNFNETLGFPFSISKNYKRN